MAICLMKVYWLGKVKKYRVQQFNLQVSDWQERQAKAWTLNFVTLSAGFKKNLSCPCCARLSSYYLSCGA